LHSVYEDDEDGPLSENIYVGVFMEIFREFSPFKHRLMDLKLPLIHGIVEELSGVLQATTPDMYSIAQSGIQIVKTLQTISVRSVILVDIAR